MLENTLVIQVPLSWLDKLNATDKDIYSTMLLYFQLTHGLLIDRCRRKVDVLWSTKFFAMRFGLL